MNATCACGSVCNYNITPVTCADGRVQLRANCAKCNRFLGFAAQGKPAEEFVMPFGKYKGKTLGEIVQTDRSYIEWGARTLESDTLRKKFNAMLAK